VGFLGGFVIGGVMGFMIGGVYAMTERATLKFQLRMAMAQKLKLQRILDKVRLFAEAKAAMKGNLER
jgi:hypothetical protein